MTSSPGALSGRSQTSASPSPTCTWSRENGSNVTSQGAPASSPVSTCSQKMRANGHR